MDRASAEAYRADLLGHSSIAIATTPLGQRSTDGAGHSDYERCCATRCATYPRWGWDFVWSRTSQKVLDLVILWSGCPRGPLEIKRVAQRAAAVQLELLGREVSEVPTADVVTGPHLPQGAPTVQVELQARKAAGAPTASAVTESLQGAAPAHPRPNSPGVDSRRKPLPGQPCRPLRTGCARKSSSRQKSKQGRCLHTSRSSWPHIVSRRRSAAH